MKEEITAKINENEMCIKGIDEVPMFSWNTKIKEFYVLGHKFDGINSIEDFINYIHNLDKENKSLQSQLKAKEEVIKEAREQLEKELELSKKDCTSRRFARRFTCEKLLEILSKGENK